MEYVRYVEPVEGHAAIFSSACDLFDRGHIFEASQAFRNVFAECVPPVTPVRFVWCDRLPGVPRVVAGLVEFMYFPHRLECMLQLEQFRARTVLVHGICNAINLVLSAIASGHLTEQSRPLLFDTADGSLEETPPKLSYCSKTDVDGLVMDPEFVFSNGYQAFRKQSLCLPPWRDRADQILWRGSTTGQVLTADARARANDALAGEWRWLQRLNLCAVAGRSLHRTFLDVGISRVVQLDSQESELVERSGFMRPGCSPKAFGAYRYSIDIDGNTNAWSSFFTKLLMGCCVLKVESPFGFRQWYYDKLRPWEHYIPIASDLSDFEEIVQVARQEPGLCEAVAERGRAAVEGITLDRAQNDAARMLRLFASQESLQN